MFTPMIFSNISSHRYSSTLRSIMIYIQKMLMPVASRVFYSIRYQVKENYQSIYYSLMLLLHIEVLSK